MIMQNIENIVYIGAIHDFYSGELKDLFNKYGIDTMRSRVAGKYESCRRPVVVINIPAHTAFIQYCDDELSEYDDDNSMFTCCVEDVEMVLKERRHGYKRRKSKGIFRMVA